MQNSLFDKIFRDNTGNVIIAQMPNPPLWVWLAATVLKLIFTSGNLYAVLDVIAFGSLFTWAWQELFDGVNYFRRTLGLVILIVVIVARIR
jgi:hypothetical protein